ncbi:DUF2993 domain-containing protein [Dietzia aerolata]|uniref:DUF2993 domain-containing protein n=1 Tax=Dietzia aerolata TaxID=595984 RepID=A0ABV5JU78_9ACTN
MKIPRIAVAAPAVVAVLAGGAYTVDAVSASRVEAEISARIAPEMPGAAPPSVMTGGPFTRWSEPGTLSSVSIRAERVARPGVAPVAVEAEATDLVATDLADTGLADTGLSAQSVVVSVQMIGDSLAQALDMRDVLIEAADDHSLAGGTEHRARVTGTVLESGERVSAIVDLVVDPSGAHLVPVAAATGPGGVPDQDPELALRATALTFAPDLLPLGVPVESLTIKGGTLTASGTGGPGTPPLDGLLRDDH